MNSKSARRAFGVGIVAVGLAACSAGSNGLGRTMSSWQGSKFDEVTTAWGEPDICETRDTRRVCSWHDLVSGRSLSSARICVRSLEIGSDDVVTGWRWRGDYCSATADRIMANSRRERPDVLDAATDEPAEIEVAATRPAERPAQGRN